MTSIDEEIEIAADPDEVWRVLGDPETAYRYVPGITSSRVEGSTRICTTADGSEIHEAISDLSAEQRSYRYEHVVTPMPVEVSRGRFSVTATAGGSKVRVEAELAARSPEMEARLVAMMQAGLRTALVNLRALFERG